MIRRVLLVLALLAATLSQPAFAQTIASKVDYVGTVRFLSVTGLKAKDVNGLLNLYIEITNSDWDDQEGYYRIAWLDESGFPVWRDEAWKPILVHGGQIAKVLVNAPTPKARDFKIEVSADANWFGSTGPASE
ncbi:MAG: YcfL family protein [Magnetospirillum sp.]|nr:YcfL family protein [Magnetospirillum sp.]